MFNTELRRLVLLLGVFGGLIHTGFVLDLNRTDWAYWVQAFGSIGAIAGATFIASAQTRRAREDRRLEALQDTYLALQIAARLRTDAFNAAQQAKGAISSNSVKYLATSLGRLERVRASIATLVTRNMDEIALGIVLDIDYQIQQGIGNVEAVIDSGNVFDRYLSPSTEVYTELNKILPKLEEHMSSVKARIDALS